ncbi:hypothetical protein EHI47_36560 [Rhizobium leguminosarum]|jgi:hypothetical protein|uniref:Integral membrane protein n=1 Tax=Rhizobium leguminosarum TaxID=384 RepID=A0A444HIN9_RHILE|nr:MULTISPECIES: hypothetical protein [Rhizobium]MBY5460275.1 hypothetical protein [Rhizobium leguminosarum]RWX21320.1 hypothetical protein EHI47_36560 [Rhizobium leguminosarum]TAU54636.1 hypothetical protein ELI43_18345 [Rhizobium leguminosarum]TBC95908.1 hypothetical protein ELH26_18560 [Rhizobium leguminosarum]UIJ79159.1 hypothetical protein LZK78_20720 [Rhizobium leguminosarum]
MRAFAGYLILMLAMPLAAIAVVLPANVYRAQGIAAPDCDGPAQVLIFAVPAVLIYGAGALLAYRAGRRFHRLVSVLCLVIALAAVPNIAEAVHELYRNAADGECRG